MIDEFKELYKKDKPKTKGEYLICRAANVDIGKDQKEPRNTPKRMSNENISKYYGGKLDKIWLMLQCDKIKAYSMEMRLKILAVQKGEVR